MENKIHFPSATYRLQFNGQFTLLQASELVDYLHRLGISHIYSSPLLKARRGSTHCYDIVDHSQLNPEIGTEKEFGDFCKTLHQKGLGIICDIIPNHMYIGDASNKWWYDVLENGQASLFADYFDIDWLTPRKDNMNKVLLPLLERRYGDALEQQTIKIAYKEGAFYVELPNTLLPTDPQSWGMILDPIVIALDKIFSEPNADLDELKSIITALAHLPSTTTKELEKREERQREKEVIKRRLDKLISQNNMILEQLNQRLEIVNGKKEDAKSFDLLESFLDAQAYRLCFWRVANDEINFRRFFDVVELAGIRTENPEVFQATHEQIFKFIKNGFVDGLRIDHVDGLWDPEQYLQNIAIYCKQLKREELFYIVVEKILIGNEQLISTWPVQGTVGYDFLNQLNGIFVYQPNRDAINQIYRNFTGISYTISELIYFCKKLILTGSMASELSVLARRLDRISEQHRSSRDFTEESLKASLRDVIACFPVYRSYIRLGKREIHHEDRQYILSAIAQAKRRNPTFNISIFDFIQSILFLEHYSEITEEHKKERENFVTLFQQLTGPVMAKGVEDTAFYRFFPLASLNEVGTNLYSFGTTVETFHKKNMERLQEWPDSMLTTSTHDAKRSEDTRARINVLSEIPNEWKGAIARWSQLNQKHKIQTDNEEVVPDANEEYLLYTTLIGTWPLYAMDPAEHLQYLERIQAYMEKANKEAKIHTSWVNPNLLYDDNVKLFVQKVLDMDEENNPFLSEFKIFVKKIASAGMLNSLSQVVLKLTSPGVPDIYQGNELWNFRLVDPDNRNVVDFTNRKYFLEKIDKTNRLPKELIEEFMRTPEDGRIKLFITTKTLHARRCHPELFTKGIYKPLAVQGERQEHLIAFTREFENKIYLVVTGRFFTSLMDDEKPNIPAHYWKGTHIELPIEFSKHRFRDVYTEIEHIPAASNNHITLSLDKIFSHLPVALLERTIE